MHLIRVGKSRYLAQQFRRLDLAAATVCYQPSPRLSIVRGTMLALIRKATAEDTARIGAIARAAYAKYVPRIGREPAPMVADFAAEVAAGRVVVIGTAGAVDGYMIAWPETDAYFIENIAIDPARQGEGLGRQLMDHAVGEAKRRRLSAIRLYTNAAMTENLSMYAHLGFVETHRAVEKGFDRVYLRWSLPDGEE
jgi:ribosomal protein S18 acetylase RimI-like enzyme